MERGRGEGGREEGVLEGEEGVREGERDGKFEESIKGFSFFITFIKQK